MLKNATLPPTLAKLASGNASATLMRGSALSLVMLGMGVVLVFLMNLTFARLLGSQQYGIFTYALSILQLIGLLPACGMDNGLLRFIPEYRVGEQWSAIRGILRLARSLAFAMATVGGIGIATGAFMFANDQMRVPLMLASCCLPPMVLIAVNSSGLRAIKCIGLSQFSEQISRPILAVIFTLLAVLLIGAISATTVIACYLAALLVVMAISGMLLRKLMPRQVREALPSYQTRSWLQVSLPMSVMSVSQQLINRTDIVLVGFLIGPTEAGIYAVVTLMARLLTFGNLATNAVLAPMISELHTRNDQAQLQNIVTISCRIGTVCSLSLALMLFVFRQPLLQLYGEQFVAGSEVLVWLLAGQIVNSVTGPVGYLLTMTGNQNESLKVNLCCALVNIFVSAASILAWGMVGAAFATALCMTAQNIWRWYIAKQRVNVSATIFAIS